MFTVTITIEPLLAAVGGGFVTVGSGVAVSVGTAWVGVSVPVGKLVTLGKGLGAGKVGKGVKVPKPKLKRGVGVATIPTLGKTLGLGTAVAEPRAVKGNKPIRTEQRKQNTSRTMPGKRIFPSGPCWL